MIFIVFNFGDGQAKNNISDSVKKKSTYDLVLFALLGIWAFLPMMQEHLRLFDLKPLNGVVVEVKQPDFTYSNYVSGRYQAQMESYSRQHFGFREAVIRMYNQYLYDFYRKTYNSEAVPGSDGWVYFVQNVNDYYGTEMYRWQPTVEEAREKYDREARLMWKLRGVLNEYGKEFLMFMAPEKGFLYPEHMPKRAFDTTSINARLYYAQKFDEYGFPYIEMTKWFQDIKEADTLPYSLFPHSGAHWSFSSVFAADSLFRFMGALKNEKLGTLKIGPLKESTPEITSGDRDLENSMNLCRRLKHKNERLLDAEVTVVSDSSTVKPNAMFVGNSFLMRMYDFISFDDLFSEPDYWYYNSTVFYGTNFSRAKHVYKIDLLQRLMDADYVVWFTNGSQMYKVSYGFVERALLALCLPEEHVERVRKQVTDSLRLDKAFMSTIDTISDTSRVAIGKQVWEKVNKIIMDDIESYFPELAGDSIPTSRNPRIAECLVVRDIKKDPNWMVVLQRHTTILNMSLDDVLKLEAQNVLNGRPLMRDDQNVVSKENYVNFLVLGMKHELEGKSQMVQEIKEKAIAKGRTYEEQLELTARWIVNDKIKKGLINIDDSLVLDMKREIEGKPQMVQAIKEKAIAKGRTYEEQLELDARWIVNDKIKKGFIDLMKIK